MSLIEPKTLQGFFDYFPEDMKTRSFVEKTIKEVFLKYGYDEINTPSIEYADILFGKYGDEEKLIYHFNDHGNRHVALRYDQTVPLARFVAQHQNKIKFPFKRFEIGRVWRADAARKARKREFMQCDADIIGEKSLLADAEILMLVSDVFKALKLDKCVLHISSREVLSSIFSQDGFDKKTISEIIKSIDKHDKIGTSGVLEEIQNKSKEYNFNFDKTQKILDKLFSFKNKSFKEIKKSLEKDLGPENESLNDLETIVSYLLDYGMKEEEDFIFNITLVRGLDYYTGMVFEVKSEDFRGSFAGGGRYDDLCSMYTDNNFSGVGVGIGFEPICAYMEENNKIDTANETVLITIFDKALVKNSLEITKLLRSNNISTQIYPYSDHKIKKQFKYANSKRNKYVIVIGESEIEKNTVMLKNMESGEQEELNQKDLVSKLSNL